MKRSSGGGDTPITGNCYATYTTDIDRARCVHRTVPMADGHNDLPWEIRRLFNQSLYEVDLSVVVPELMTDMPR